MCARRGSESIASKARMDRRLLQAAISGDAAEMNHLAVDEPGVLHGTTPQGNNCLHIAAIHGHEGFCKDVLQLQQSLTLFTAVNEAGETPLLTAVTRGRESLASVLLGFCRDDQQLKETILKQDKCGCNVLHHAIRRGYRALALELIEAEPALSKAANERDESPMFIAAMRNFEDVLDKLLGIPDSADSGAFGFNALHAAVRNGNKVMAQRIIETRPWLVSQESEDKDTPMHMAAYEDKIDVLTALLQHDPSLGYLISTAGKPLLCTAASEGHVGIAQELLKHCPDAPYSDEKGLTCLHQAVLSGQEEFVEFVLRSQELQYLINLADNNGATALHLAARNGARNMIRAFLLHQDIDVTMLDNTGNHAKALITVADDTTSTISSSEVATTSTSLSEGATTESSGVVAVTTGDTTAIRPQVMMDQLLDAAVCGHVAEMRHLYLHVPGVLDATTPQGNTCLHIAAIHGRDAFCRESQALNPSLLAAANSDGETPLLAAVASGHLSVASLLLGCCRERNLSEAILEQDKRGNNALHHAIRSGHKELALKLIEAEPALSKAVNEYGESPMFIAVMRNYEDVFDKLCEVPDFAHGGVRGKNALHAAVANGNSAIAKKIMETRPALATEHTTTNGNTPMHLAVFWDKIDVLRVLLEKDRSLGYIVSRDGSALLNSAAYRGHVGVARELLKHCPDTPYTSRTGTGRTCLHVAVYFGRMEFVDFVLASPQLRGHLNMRDSDGNTALHLAIQKCNSKMVAALLLQPEIDVTVLNNAGSDAIWELEVATEHSKTLNWNEISMLMLKAAPQATTDIYNLRKQAHDEVIESSREDIRSLTQTYTGNTSLVAILIATITFAAAFTLPGGYSSDAGNEGLPVMARKFAFKAFLISDTLAMCSSLAVAFVCVIAKWEDLEFLLYYRSRTKKLMWFAYMATTTAFATGLYTVLAPRLPWLAIVICILTSLLPILTKLLGEWPILRLRFRLGRTFNSELLDMV